MRLKINGEVKVVKDVFTIMDLLDRLGVRQDRVAVEVNLEIVRREQRDAFQLNDGDTIEIVSFIGGG